MGTRGRQIVGMDVDQLLAALNSAYADEWLAYHQYWLGAKLAKGPLRGQLVAEMEEHAEEEMKHLLLLAERILQLGGTPLLTPGSWMDESDCGYTPPENPIAQELLDENIEAERCAIDAYNRLAAMTKDTDPATYRIAVEILRDEIEHEENLETLKEDLHLLHPQADGSP